MTTPKYEDQLDVALYRIHHFLVDNNAMTPTRGEALDALDFLRGQAMPIDCDRQLQDEVVERERVIHAYLEANQRTEITDEAVREAVDYIAGHSYDIITCVTYSEHSHRTCMHTSTRFDTNIDLLKQALSERDALKARVKVLEKTLKTARSEAEDRWYRSGTDEDFDTTWLAREIDEALVQKESV